MFKLGIHLDHYLLVVEEQLFTTVSNIAVCHAQKQTLLNYGLCPRLITVH